MRKGAPFSLKKTKVVGKYHAKMKAKETNGNLISARARGDPVTRGHAKNCLRGEGRGYQVKTREKIINTPVEQGDPAPGRLGL